jgi:hypothetical protein
MRLTPLIPTVLCIAVAAVAAAGCGDPAPASVRVDVNFPSIALAIASDTVKFIVYDDSSDGACQSIYLKHVTGQVDLPPVLLDGAPIAVCDLAAGKQVSLSVPLGKHAVLAVSQRAKSDLLVGCSDLVLTKDGGEVTIDLALPGTTPAPSLSTCLSLKDACNKVCQ